jgi:two-component system OmpR family response regulator
VHEAIVKPLTLATRGQNAPMHVLVVEDDERLADVLVRGLSDAGHDVTLRRNGRDGLRAAMAGAIDAVILDWMLPIQDGASVCRELRMRGNHTPVLMLTARQAVPDRIGGLDAGADDYLTKPFSFDELLARLRVFARRSGHQELLRVDDLVIERDRRQVWRADVPVVLTAREFDLLTALAERAGRIVTRVQILDEVWDGETDLRSNAIDVHVGKLRAKIDRPFGRDTIETIRGIGFRLRHDDWN